MEDNNEVQAIDLRKHYQDKLEELKTEVGRIVVGQEHMISRLLIGLFTQGHILLEGVPGLAKTLTVNTLTKVLDLDFKRLQFTPDLLPADLIGTMIYNQKESVFEVKKGPIFANLILADEVNRSPAKVQSALLEAMQEKQVTIGDHTFKLDKPFLVLATQNPVEQEGTYPLPEAQLDRFMMKIFVDYPTKDEEYAIMKRMSNLDFKGELRKILNREDIFNISTLINDINTTEAIERYIVDLVYATRRPKEIGLKDEANYIQFGVSPRASINLMRASKAIAFFSGRDFVLPDDVKEVAVDVLAHRMLLNYEAEADGVKSSDIVNAIMKKVVIK